MTKTTRRRARKARSAGRKNASPEILTESMRHAVVTEEPPERAGLPPRIRKSGAHRRLAASELISPEAENAAETYIRHYEIHCGAREGGVRTGDRPMSHADVLIASTAWLRVADAALGVLGRALLIHTCVECRSISTALGHDVSPPSGRRHEDFQKQLVGALGRLAEAVEQPKRVAKVA